MIEAQNADCVDVLLSAPRSPPPVVTRGNSENEMILIDSDINGHPPWKSVAHWILDTGHPLLLLWKKIILPNLIRIKSIELTHKRRGRTYIKAI